ncbi:hypothetical protein ccbrp13_55870 [Ktedonobacteria bacterium brp13]|nr:hypothetical protein ccbrp13_55870 [Ktedonobacteria bacterium brp13]
MLSRLALQACSDYQNKQGRKVDHKNHRKTSYIHHLQTDKDKKLSKVERRRYVYILILPLQGSPIQKYI